jgi:biotin-dependent carboxylase-like uncharacterized protein
MTPVIRIERPGLSASIQDPGRPGLARFGVPQSGAMDDEAAAIANRLVGNPEDAPVIELLLRGAVMEILADAVLAITGADASCTLPMWKCVDVQTGDRLTFPVSRAGLWTYVAIGGELEVPRYFGSASIYPRGGLGRQLASGDVLTRKRAAPRDRSVRIDHEREHRDYTQPPRLRVWPGPQRDLFTTDARASFFQQAWTVSSRSDRIGFRLEGVALPSSVPQIPSEPVLPGAIQIPPDGRPIVTMRDGPTVGGYPQIGLLEPGDVSWLAQCRPGTQVHFTPIDEDAAGHRHQL